MSLFAYKLSCPGNATFSWAEFYKYYVIVWDPRITHMNRVDDVAFISGNNYALDPIRIGNNQIHYKKCSHAKQTHGIFRLNK